MNSTPGRKPDIHLRRVLRRPAWRRLRRETIGTPPGSLVTTEADTPTHIHVMTYRPGADGPGGKGGGNDGGAKAPSGSVTENHFDVAPGQPIPDYPEEPDGGVRWINVLGVHDGALLRELGGRYGMHTLMLEDIQHTDQRPKFQEAEDSFFAVLRMISWRQDTGLDVEQVALHATGRTVISFQERPGDVFDGIRERIRTGRGRVRRSTADYLFYAILDAVIDTAFLVVDEIQEQVEDLENRILGAPQEAALSRVHHLRGEVIAVRRALRPLREMLQLASRGDYAYFSEPTYPFLADGYDHILALLDGVDAEMDRVTGLFQLHASMVGASTNEVMRVLTIIATIFIPLTFIAGIYGMNFAVMPELAWRYGYPAILAVMFLVGAGMVVYFRRRKWF